MPGDPVRPETTLAIILGASVFPLCTQLYAESPSFENSAREFERYLRSKERGFGLPARNLLPLFNTSKTPAEIDARIAKFLQPLAANAKDLILYYVGHGAFTGPNQDYYLALKSTNYSNPPISSLRMTDLARRLKEDARNVRRFLIIDSCFAAASFVEWQSPPLELASLKTLESFPPSGTALLCSSNRNEVSKAPLSEKHTMFSGALLELLETGDNKLEDDFTFEELGHRVRIRIREKYADEAVRPQVLVPDQAKGDIARIPLFPNPAKEPAKRREDEENWRIDSPSPDIARKRRLLSVRSLAVLAIAAVFFVFAGTFSYRRFYFPIHPTVAVWEFAPDKNNIPVESVNWRGAEIRQKLFDELSGPTGFRVVSAEDVSKVQSTFETLQNSPLQEKQIPEVMKALGATGLILGRYRLEDGSEGKRLTLTASVFSEYGSTLRDFTAAGPLEKVDLTIQTLATDIRNWGRKAVLDQEAVERLAYPYPHDPAVRQHYYEAMCFLDVLDGEKALAELQQAQAKEPSSIAVHLGLADAWKMLRHDSDATKEALRAEKLADAANSDKDHLRIPEEFQKLVHARATESQSLWKAAASEYKVLYGLGSDKLRYGLRLASALTFTNDSDDFKAALDTLNELGKSKNPDPRINLQQSTVFLLQGKFQDSLDAAKRARSQAHERNLSLVMADADLNVCWASQKLADQKAPDQKIPAAPKAPEPGTSQPQDACEEAYRIFGEHDKASQAVALNQIATRLADQYVLDQAFDMYRQVLRLTVGSEKDQAGALLNQARVEIRRGNFEQAQELLKESLRHSKPIDDKYDELRAKILLTTAKESAHAITESAAIAETQPIIDEASADLSAQAYAFDSLGTYQLNLGDLRHARDSFQDGLKLHREIGETKDAAVGLTNVGETYSRQGDWAQAEIRYKQALDMLPEAERMLRAQVQMALADLALEKEDRPSAGDYTDKAFNALKSSTLPDLISQAAELRVRFLVLTGRQAQAAEFAKMIALPGGDVSLTFYDFCDQIDARLAQAIYLWTGSKEDKNKALGLLNVPNRKSEDPSFEFERLQALSQVAKFHLDSQGRTPAVRLELASIASQADSKGFLGIKRETTDLLQNTRTDH